MQNFNHCLLLGCFISMQTMTEPLEVAWKKKNHQTFTVYLKNSANLTFLCHRDNSYLLSLTFYQWVTSTTHIASTTICNSYMYCSFSNLPLFIWSCISTHLSPFYIPQHWHQHRKGRNTIFRPEYTVQTDLHNSLWNEKWESKKYLSSLESNTKHELEKPRCLPGLEEGHQWYPRGYSGAWWWQEDRDAFPMMALYF